ncbi:serine/threonine protein kinase [Vibrio fortis]|jgi:serine/threonine-protein kinase|uniref:serine/threonine protein kinase n=1 Tax=Vibrio fortis TaxID=212667 RepID=UPI0021C44579|nr:serine/threonine-protein kinase [Vibrio fortis]
MDFNPSSTQLFYQLIDKNISERELILADVRRNSPKLAGRVDELLKHANNDSAIDALEAHLSTATEKNTCYESLIVDRYIVGHELGRGGFASVYYATRSDSLFHHQYAIKFFHPEILGLLGQKVLFSEAQLLANVSHSNIAKVYDAGTYHGAVYIVMEYVDGMNLHHYLSAYSLSFEQKLVLFRDICLAVDYAHQHQIIHGDLKPENILICHDGTPKIIDFNIAQKVQDSDPKMSTQGVLALTRNYASPEQLNKDTINSRTDVYALGRILYLDVLRARPRGDIKKVVAVATHSDPQRRYFRAKDLAKDIENVRCLFPLSRESRVGVEVLKKFLIRSPIFTLCSGALGLSMVAITMALSTATYDLNRQKQNLDTVLNDVTTSVYPLNNRLTDWESVIENRENQRRLLLGPQSRSFLAERRSEFTPSIHVLSSIAVDEVELAPIAPILGLPEGGVVNDENHPLDEAVTSNESVG